MDKNIKSDFKKKFALMLDFFKLRKLLVLFTFVIFAINASASIISPVYLGKLIDTFKNKSKFDLSQVLSGGKEFLFLFSIIIICQIISGILNSYLKKESGIHYQELILGKILMLPYLKLIEYRTAYLQSRWISDSMNLSNFYGENLFEILKNILIIIFGIGVSLYILPKFSLFVIVFIAIVSICVFGISRYLIKQLKKYLEEFSTLSGKVNETIAGVIELKIMGFIDLFKTIISSNIKSTANRYFSIQIKALIIFAFINLFIFSGFFGILIYFGFMLANNEVTVGTAIGFIAVIFFIIRSLSSLVSGINKLNTSFASLNRTAELFELKLKPLEKNEKTKIDKNLKPIQSITLKNIWFKYKVEANYIIRNFSYKFKKGNVYALTGESGVGKSTLIKILMGIIEADKGTILINDVYLNDEIIPLFWNKIGYLSQDPFLFKGKLVDNLKPLVEEKSDESHLKKAFCDSGLENLESIYKIEVEEGGKNFSGGERRRIALARAFIKKVDILILDEPTSQVDQKREKIMMNSIISFARKGKIVIIIAHSHFTLDLADEIIDLSLLKKKNS